MKHISNECSNNPERTLTVLSLGSGNCDLEANLSSKLVKSGICNFHFSCLDINPDMLARGKKLASDMNVSRYLHFERGDFNRWTPDRKQIDIVLANQSLHHVQELEHLFSSVKRVIGDTGIFLISDMIGRNGHQRWPEALKALQPFWEELPDEYKYNQLIKRHEPEYINHDCSTEGFEGIRAQDILPLLVKNFNFQFLFPFGNIIFTFVDRPFGHNFDATAEWDQSFVDRVHECDENGLLSGELKPTSMLAVVGNSNTETQLRNPVLTPEFCVRETP